MVDPILGLYLSNNSSISFDEGTQNNTTSHFVIISSGDVLFKLGSTIQI